MDWYFYSLLAALLLAINFLLVKKLGVQGVSVYLVIIYTYGIAAMALLAYFIISRQNLSVPSSSIIFIILAGLSVLVGMIFLFRGVYTAPNPGYATAIGSIQVLLVVVASIFLFKSEFSWMKVLGTVLVVAGVILLGS